MQRMSLPGNLSSILLLGAHCDDIEIGCSATVLRLLQEFPELRLTWVVFSSNVRRRAEAEAAATAIAGEKISLEILDFRNGYFPYVGSTIKDYFEELKIRVTPDLIFTHSGQDLHQDHRLISDLTWNTFRDHTILEYEIPKFDGGVGSPSVFFPISKTITNQKLAILDEHFESQKGRPWFSSETFAGLMRIRGVECNAPEGYAEAFFARKMVF